MHGPQYLGEPFEIATVAGVTDVDISGERGRPVQSRRHATDEHEVDPR